MLRKVLKRILISIPVLVGVVLLIFIMLRIVPGDPVTTMIDVYKRQDYTEAIPAYVAVIAMPFMYSISEGIAMGIISYVVINLVTGKAKEKNITPLMYVLAVLFVLKYILL